ncbi:unnamed protein product, partial [marine sediment metagenome]
LYIQDNKYESATFLADVISGVTNINKGMSSAVNVNRIYPALTYEFANNAAITADQDVTFYSREGETEILGGVIYAEGIGIKLIVDGITVLSTDNVGAVGLNRGQDDADNNYSVCFVPPVYAKVSVELHILELLSTTQAYGAMVYTKEY